MSQHIEPDAKSEHGVVNCGPEVITSKGGDAKFGPGAKPGHKGATVFDSGWILYIPRCLNFVTPSVVKTIIIQILRTIFFDF